MKRAVLLALVTLGGLAAPSSASASLQLDPAVWPYQSWVDASLVPTPDVTVTFDYGPGACGGVPACFDHRPRIGLDSAPPFKRKSLLHEVGHAFSYYTLTRDERFDLGDAMPGRPSNPDLWWTRTGTANNSTNEEWFADSYSWCARTSPVPGRWYSTGDGTTKGERLAGVCDLIAGD